MNNQFIAVIPSPELPVLVIGTAGVDIVGWLKGELLPRTSSPAQIRTSYGGVARNVAENLARLGQPVRLITAVGKDQAGDQLLQATSEAGVDVECALRSSQYPTGTYLAIVNTGGELQFGLDDMRAASALSGEYLRQYEGLFRESSLVFFDANLPKESIRTIFTLARRARVPVCADPTSRILASRLLPYLPRLSMIAPNVDEAGVLCDRTISATNRRDALEAAKCLVGQGVGVVIITLAEFGVCYATSETSGHVPAIQTAIVDPTGAGDALTATMVFSLLNGIPIDDAVRLGVTAASLTLRHRGAVLSDLSLEKLYHSL
ncbi:MAG: carbohydrate kinase family protein [Anaerolineales bacterium]|nr:carbohydrate kinase family protein [Anaerolineales bacterium]